MDDFQRCLVLECGHSNDPSSAGLEDLLIFDIAQPKIDLREVLFHFKPDAVEVGERVSLGRDVTEQNVLPQSVTFGLLEAQNEGAAVLIVFVLPNWFDVLSEEVDVRAHWQFGGSLEVLIVCPEVLDRGDNSDWLKAVFEGAFSLDEVLVPKLEFRP